MSTLRVNNVQEAGGSAVITSGIVDKGSLPTGSILQVVQSVKTDTFSASVAQGAVSTDAMTATITPLYATSKILVTVSATANADDTQATYLYLYRGGSASGYAGDTAGSRVRVAVSVQAGTDQAIGLTAASWTYLDSPATTSATTYSVRLGHSFAGSKNVYLNRGQTDTDANTIGRGASSITLLEVAG